MHMKDNHMRNAQLKPGYNVQIGVDSEYIVAADSGYESEESYTYLREQKQKPYIKPQTYDKWKNAVSSRISANVKIWDIMKQPIKRFLPDFCTYRARASINHLI